MANLRGNSQTYVHRCTPDGPLAVMTLSGAARKRRWPATITVIQCAFGCRPDPVFVGVHRAYADRLDVELNTCLDCGAGPEEDCTRDCPKGTGPDAMRWSPTPDKESGKQ